MRISPINFSINSVEKASIANGYVPATSRHNSLADMDFNIVADTIRCQNLKNQMNVRLMNLKRSLNSCMAQNLYQNG